MVSRLKIGTKIAASFALGLVMFAALAIIDYHNTTQLIETSQWEAHTYQVLEQLKDLDGQIKGAESSQRGYIITGDQAFLAPYNAAVVNLDRILKQLRQLTADNPNQQRRLNIIEPLVQKRIDLMQKPIDLRREQGFEASQKRVIQGIGLQLMQQIGEVVTDMENEERLLLEQRTQSTRDSTRRTIASITYGVPLYSALLVVIGLLLARNISRPLGQLSQLAEQVAVGNLALQVPALNRRDEIGSLNRAFNQMIISLRETTRKNEEQNWLNANLAKFTQMLQGQRDLPAVGRMILSELAPLIEAQQGAFYLLDAEANPPVLKLLSTYAYQERKQLSNQFHLGESLVGQSALEKQRILLTNVPGDYIRINSGLGEIQPLNIIVQPVLFEEQVTAVLELASLQRFSETHLLLLQRLTQTIGVILNTITFDTRNRLLLEQSQALAAELQEGNQRLEEQAEELRQSEGLLREQQEELQQTNEELQQLNEELEEKAELLSAQKREVEHKNEQIETARQELTQKAEQLALSSKYKSEFLANMSHELRTPLNSLLILARLLVDNSEGNLTEKQVDYSRTIYSAGTDLLELINDILDLAKIESGMMTLSLEAMPFADLQIYLHRTFEQIAADKQLSFQILLDPDLPATLTTDAKRLQQILKNLLSNAFKFTDQGEVRLHISLVEQTSATGNRPSVVFSVQDTGIGIALDKQQIIFEAFQQADGTTSRRYGGTGLGLSISRELAHLLGGSIQLQSQLGQGSTFTLYLPLQPSSEQQVSSPAPASISSPLLPETAASAVSVSTALPAAPMTLPDDRERIQSGDRILLIIEDDINFARILLEMAHQQEFKALIATQGGAGLLLAQEFRPNAIMLDIRLPDMDGWTVLDRLKHDPDTRHIPVHILSIDEEQQRGLQLGAIDYLQKPVSPEAITQALTSIKGFVERRVKQLLVIEDDPVQAQSIIELIGNGDVKSTAVHTGAKALELLKAQAFDCVVLDLGLPDISGFELLNQIKQNSQLTKLPIIVYTGKELSRQEETELRRFAETIIIKDVRSPERLLDETTLFLHRVQSNLPQRKQQILEQLCHDDPVLANKRVLIVDDDVRNIFALTSLLERYQMQIIYAENGRDGIQQLEAHPDVNIILMDVMMPEMDGYETTRAIRQQNRFQTLPIIALTAKAMQGDREKCLEAGASDYITKPVDTEQLLSLLRVWLYSRE
jgi:CheY-like chemotaxis protein